MWFSMGIFTECPWCDKEFKSSSYPRSAGIREVIIDEKEHMKETHPDLTDEYNEILDIWYEKVVNGDSGIDSFIKAFKNMTVNREGASKPRPEIVLEYKPDDLEEMDEEEIRRIIEKY